MPSFQISDPTSTLSLTDATEGGQVIAKGEVVFAIENVTAVKRTATIKVVSSNEGDQAAFRLEGATPTSQGQISLDFEPRQTRNVTVSIAAKRGVGARKSAFHLRVMRELDEDNDVTESRPIAFDVPGQAATPVQKAGFPWWIAAAAVLAVVIAGGAVYLFWPTDDPPATRQATRIEDQVSEKTVEFARGIVTGAGLKPVVRVGVRPSGETNKVFNAVRDSADPNKLILTYDPGLDSLTGKPVAAAKELVTQWNKDLDTQWQLTPEVVTDPNAPGEEPGLVTSVKLEGTTPPRVVLTYDEGIAVPNLKGSSPTRIGDVFIPLAGKATATIERTFDDPQSCATEITEQRPLKDPAPGSISHYKTNRSFFFTVREGKKADCRSIGDTVIRWREILSPSIRLVQ